MRPQSNLTSPSAGAAECKSNPKSESSVSPLPIAAGSKSPAWTHWLTKKWIHVLEHFEYVVVFALSLIIAVVIVIAMAQLYHRTIPLILGGAMDPLDHVVFQQLFGAIFTVLIALEFKHSIVRATARRDSLVSVRAVLLIALLAMSRKFVILDPTNTSPMLIASLALVTLVLGTVYWILTRKAFSEEGG